jgi:hypothetical protein
MIPARTRFEGEVELRWSGSWPSTATPRPARSPVSTASSSRATCRWATPTRWKSSSTGTACFKPLKPFVLRQAERLKRHARAVATQAGRPWQYLEGPIRKDQHARAIAARDGVTEGLVCVFGTVEPCRSFRLAYQHGRPALRPARRKCLFLYFYCVDREFGFLHVRLQTWFPFTIQVYVNGPRVADAPAGQTRAALPPPR